MKQRRFNFADEYEKTPPPPSVWLTRVIITSLIASIGVLAHMAGYLPFSNG